MSEKRAVREAAANPGKPDGVVDNEKRAVSVAKDAPRLNDTRKVKQKSAGQPEMGGRKIVKPTAHVGKPALNLGYMGARQVSVAKISEGETTSDGNPPQGENLMRFRQGGTQTPSRISEGPLDNTVAGMGETTPTASHMAGMETQPHDWRDGVAQRILASSKTDDEADEMLYQQARQQRWSPEDIDYISSKLGADASLVTPFVESAQVLDTARRELAMMIQQHGMRPETALNALRDHFSSHFVDTHMNELKQLATKLSLPLGQMQAAEPQTTMQAPAAGSSVMPSTNVHPAGQGQVEPGMLGHRDYELTAFAEDKNKTSVWRDLKTSFGNGFRSTYKSPEAAPAAGRTPPTFTDVPPTADRAKQIRVHAVKANALKQILNLQPAGKKGDYDIFAHPDMPALKLMVSPRSHVASLVMETREAVLEMAKLAGTSEEIKDVFVKQSGPVARTTGSIEHKAIGSQTPTAKVGKPELNLDYMGRRSVPVKQIREDFAADVERAKNLMIGEGMSAAQATDAVIADRSDPHWKKLFDSLRVASDEHYDRQSEMSYPMESISPHLAMKAEPGKPELNRGYLELLDIDVKKIEEDSALEMTGDLKSVTDKLGYDIHEVYSPRARYVGTAKKKTVKPAFTGNSVRHIGKQRRRWS